MDKSRAKMDKILTCLGSHVQEPGEELRGRENGGQEGRE